MGVRSVTTATASVNGFDEVKIKALTFSHGVDDRVDIEKRSFPVPVDNLDSKPEPGEILAEEVPEEGVSRDSS
jgi:hypothetical protein